MALPSSSKRSFGFRRSARAMAKIWIYILEERFYSSSRSHRYVAFARQKVGCLSVHNSFDIPLSKKRRTWQHWLSNDEFLFTLGSVWMNSWILALFAASRISSTGTSLRPLSPYAMLSCMDMLKRTGSCATRPTEGSANQRVSCGEKNYVCTLRSIPMKIQTSYIFRIDQLESKDRLRISRRDHLYQATKRYIVQTFNQLNTGRLSTTRCAWIDVMFITNELTLESNAVPKKKTFPYRQVRRASLKDRYSTWTWVEGIRTRLDLQVEIL